MLDQKQPSWLRKVWAKVRKKARPETPKPNATSTVGVTQATVGKLKGVFFEIDSKRMAVYSDALEMDDTVDEVASALDILADNSVNSEDGSKGAFTIVFQEGKEHSTVVEEVIKRTRWREKAYAIARDTILYGDTFLQYIIDKNLLLVRLMYMPPVSMFRNENDAGLLLEGTKPGEAAFEQYRPGTNQRVAWWYPYQIEHIRWNRSGSRVYGRSLLSTARTAWKKWQAMEEALVINWLTRAFARLLFILDVTGKTPKEAEAYINTFATSLTTRAIASGVKGKDELSVVKDIYIGRAMHDIGGRAYPGQTDVKILDTANSGFLNLSPIEYYQNKVMTSLRVPKAHLGLERDINAKATLQQQDRRFLRILRRIQSMLSEAIEHTIKLQLVLLGIDPNSVELIIMWPTPSWADVLEGSAATKNFAEADEKLLALGLVDSEFIQTRHLRMSKIEIDRIAAAPKPKPTVEPEGDE